MPFRSFYTDFCHGSSLAFKVFLNVSSEEELEQLKKGDFVELTEFNCARKRFTDKLQEEIIISNKEEALEKAIHLLLKKLEQINILSDKNFIYKTKDLKNENK